MRWVLATIVFWLALSVSPARIHLDQLPEMGLVEMQKTFSEVWKARVGVPAHSIDLTLKPTKWRLQIIRDEKEHMK